MLNFKFLYIRAMLLMVTFLFWNSSYAQELKVIVRDAEGKPLPAASVSISNKKAITDQSGQIIFNKVEYPAKLMVSYVGFISIDTTLSGIVSEVRFRLRESSTMLENSLVIASWAPDNGSVTQKTIKKTDFYLNSPSDMPALLENLPGSVSTSDAGNGIGYSGIRIRGSDQSRINVMIDGVPVNDAESQNVFWVDLPDLIEDVEMVQVQRGVGVSTSGPGAFGANINLQTGKLSDDMGVSANAGYGSFNSQKYGLAYSTGRFGKYFNMKLRGSRITSDGYIDRATSDLWAGSVQTQFKKDKLTLAANIYWGKERTYQAWNGMPIQYYLTDNKSTYNSAGLKSNGTFFDDETDNYRQLYSRIIGTYDFKKSSLKLTFYNTLGKGYYNQYREENINDYFEDVEFQDVSLVRERWLDNDLLGINLLYGFKANKWNIQIGGNAQNYAGKHYGIIKTIEQINVWKPREYYSNEANKFESSVFLKGEKRFNNISVLADFQGRNIKYEYEGLNTTNDLTQLSKSYTFFNPKLGLSYYLNEISSFYLYGGVAHKEPNRDDFTDAAPGKLPNPERLINSEIGYRYTANKFQLTFNQYTMWYKDQLVLTGKINDVGAYTRFNVDESYRIGVELDFKYKISDWVSLNSNLALSKNKIPDFTEFIDASAIVNGEFEYLDQEARSLGTTDISFSPKAIFFGQISFNPFSTTQNLFKRAALSYNYKYVSSQYLDNTSNEFAQLDGYTLHGFSIQVPFKFKKTGLTLDFRLDNAFDKIFVNNGWIYRFKAGGYDASEGDPTVQKEGGDYFSAVGYFPQAGRRFYVGLKFTL